MNTWHYLHTDVALLAFTKTNGEFDFELHYECRGMHLLKERIERFLSELALLKGPAVTAWSQFDGFTLIRESSEQIQNAENPERSVESFVYVSVLWVFCPVNTLGHSPKNGIYFCSARHIFSHIGICH